MEDEQTRHTITIPYPDGRIDEIEVEVTWELRKCTCDTDRGQEEWEEADPVYAEPTDAWDRAKYGDADFISKSTLLEEAVIIAYEHTGEIDFS